MESNLTYIGTLPLREALKVYKGSKLLTYSDKAVDLTVYIRLAIKDSNSSTIISIPVYGKVTGQNEYYMDVSGVIPMTRYRKPGVIKFLAVISKKTLKIPYGSALYGVHPEIIYEKLYHAYKSYIDGWSIEDAKQHNK